MPRQVKRNVVREDTHAEKQSFNADTPMDGVLLVSDYPYMIVEVGPRPNPLSRPPSVQFVLTDFDHRRERYVGTLLLNEENWRRWFGDKELFPAYGGTWQEAARAIAKLEGVRLGCTYCPETFMEWDDMVAHRRKHGVG